MPACGLACLHSLGAQPVANVLVISRHVFTITVLPSCPPWVQLKLDEARAVQEMDARMAAAATQRADQAAGAPPPAQPPGRTVSNLQLEVQAEQALADEQEGEAGTAQTLLELCSREGVVPWRASQLRVAATLTPLQAAALAQAAPPYMPALMTRHDQRPGHPSVARHLPCHPSPAVAPQAERYVRYHEEWLKRCLLRIFSAPPRSGGPAWPGGACTERMHCCCRCFPHCCCTLALSSLALLTLLRCPTLLAVERQQFRLAALRECHSCMWKAGISALPYEAAVWLLEEEEEIKGGHVHVGGQVGAGGGAGRAVLPANAGVVVLVRSGVRSIAWLCPVLHGMLVANSCMHLVHPCRWWAARARWPAACRRAARGTWAAASRCAQGEAEASVSVPQQRSIVKLQSCDVACCQCLPSISPPCLPSCLSFSTTTLQAVLYALENFARRMVHQFPTNPTAQVCLGLMLRRRACQNGTRPVPQALRRQLEQVREDQTGI